jgi:hypothetical protein
MAAPRLNFAQIHGFPEDFNEGKIETAKFIDASTEVIGILESFGTLFTPVVSDMRGNVNQLKGHYEKDVEQRKFVEDMILADKTMATHPWLLWLKRALELIERFFFYVLQSEEVVKGKEENLSPMIRKAYDEVLRPYHGFLLQNTFKVSRNCHFPPSILICPSHSFSTDVSPHAKPSWETTHISTRTSSICRF